MPKNKLKIFIKGTVVKNISMLILAILAITLLLQGCETPPPAHTHTWGPQYDCPHYYNQPIYDNCGNIIGYSWINQTHTQRNCTTCMQPYSTCP